jgi:transcriptional regulator with XRE-family HTH domain
MNIGETIKKLRKQKDMTQEQLAEYLNISPQAVSRWEINSTLPDITLVPMLANIFDVTTDMLLGVDIDTKEKRIEAIRKEAENYTWENKYDEAIQVLRSGLKEYPNSHVLADSLASYLSVKIGFYDKK